MQYRESKYYHILTIIEYCSNNVKQFNIPIDTNLFGNRVIQTNVISKYTAVSGISSYHFPKLFLICYATKTTEPSQSVKVDGICVCWPVTRTKARSSRSISIQIND